MTKKQIDVLARRTADTLFVNGSKERAQRLVLTVDGPPSRNLGGWGFLPVVEIIKGALLAALAPTPEEPNT